MLLLHGWYFYEYLGNGIIMTFVVYTHTHTHTTLFTKAWQIQSIDISVRKENNYIYNWPVMISEALQ